MLKIILVQGFCPLKTKLLNFLMDSVLITLKSQLETFFQKSAPLFVGLFVLRTCTVYTVQLNLHVRPALVSHHLP